MYLITIEHIFETGTFKIQAKKKIRFVRMPDHHSDFWLIYHYSTHFLTHSLTQYVIHRMPCPSFYCQNKDTNRAVPCLAVPCRLSNC
jgi:hypothetical protein